METVRLLSGAGVMWPESGLCGGERMTVYTVLQAIEMSKVTV